MGQPQSKYRKLAGARDGQPETIFPNVPLVREIFLAVQGGPDKDRESRRISNSQTVTTVLLFHVIRLAVMPF